jgi:hypothetical protein
MAASAELFSRYPHKRTLALIGMQQTAKLDFFRMIN